MDAPPAVILSVLENNVTAAGPEREYNLKHKKAGGTQGCSRTVPQSSTDRALRRLTSEFGRDPVYSARYGRQRRTCSRIPPKFPRRARATTAKSGVTKSQTRVLSAQPWCEIRTEICQNVPNFSRKSPKFGRRKAQGSAGAQKRPADSH